MDPYCGAAPSADHQAVDMGPVLWCLTWMLTKVPLICFGVMQCSRGEAAAVRECCHLGRVCLFCKNVGGKQQRKPPDECPHSTLINVIYILIGFDVLADCCMEFPGLVFFLFFLFPHHKVGTVITATLRFNHPVHLAFGTILHQFEMEACSPKINKKNTTS